MDSIGNRKNELTRLKLVIDSIQSEEIGNLMAATTFPRVFSHYEKYILESLDYIVNEIYSDNPKISDLKLPVKLLLLSLSHYKIKDESILNNLRTISPLSKVEIFDKGRVLSNIKNGKPHELLDKYLEGFDVNYHSDYTKLINLFRPIRTKYRSRCNIAHGNIDLSDIQKSDWFFIRDKVIEFLDTIKTIAEDYICDKAYLK